MDIVRKFVIVTLVGAAGIAVSAEQRRGEVVLVRPPASPIQFAGPWRPAGVGADTRVIGSVIDIGHVPVPFAHVQLRNLTSGAVIAAKDTNANGEYAFAELEPGTFVVEMVVSDNRVVALSNAGSLSRYETLQTRIQLAGRWNPNSRSMQMLVGATAFFGIGSARSMTSSTIALAADAGFRPVDAGEPVSPQ